MDLAETEWSNHRRYLFAVAYRMLGSAVDAEDVVQDAYLRARSAEVEKVDDVRAWLTTIVARLCLDQLKSARVRREAYVGTWLPEPLVDYDDSDLSDSLVLAEQLRLPAMLMLEQLSPAERVAFVLHDGFGMDYDRLALVLSRSAAACRQLVSRGRRALAAVPVSAGTTDDAAVQRVISAVMAASRTGDVEALVKVLNSEIVLRSDGGGVVPAARRPILGAPAVARLLIGLTKLYPDLQHLPVTVNGGPGALLLDGQAVTAVVAYTLGEENVLAIEIINAPDKIAWSSARIARLIGETTREEIRR